MLCHWFFFCCVCFANRKMEVYYSHLQGESLFLACHVILLLPDCLLLLAHKVMLVLHLIVLAVLRILLYCLYFILFFFNCFCCDFSQKNAKKKKITHQPHMCVCWHVCVCVCVKKSTKKIITSSCKSSLLRCWRDRWSCMATCRTSTKSHHISCYVIRLWIRYTHIFWCCFCWYIPLSLVIYVYVLHIPFLSCDLSKNFFFLFAFFFFCECVMLCVCCVCMTLFLHFAIVFFLFCQGFVLVIRSFVLIVTQQRSQCTNATQNTT